MNYLTTQIQTWANAPLEISILEKFIPILNQHLKRKLKKLRIHRGDFYYLTYLAEKMSYSQETIKNVLFGSTRQMTNILEIVKFVHISLEEIDKLLDTTEGSLRSHHKTLTRVRQILKMLQKRQRVPALCLSFWVKLGLVLFMLKDLWNKCVEQKGS